MFTLNLKKQLFAITFCLFNIGGFAQTTPPSQDSSEQTSTSKSVLRLVSKASDRKRSPSNLYIEVVYINGNIVLTSVQDELITELRLENSSTGQTYIITSIGIGEVIPIELAPGQYELTAKLLDDNIFWGIMIINRF